MSFPVESNYGYGDGSSGNCTPSSADVVINNYARVAAISSRVVTVDNVTSGGFKDFVVGTCVLAHVAGYKGANTICVARGKWVTRKITAVSGSALTLDKDISEILSGFALDQLYVQLVTIPEFKTVTLNSSKSISCPQFNYSTGVGGIVAFKCSSELKFNGGYINLANKGFTNDTNWEHGQIYSTEQVKVVNGNIQRANAGWENYRARYHLPINYPDCACWIMAKKMTCHADSRIGNKSKTGVARSRGAAATLAGGSAIMIAAEEIVDWTPAIIAKYSSTADGRGLPRCYIASETTLPTDEALYAYDKVSDPTRLTTFCTINSFGNGQRGSFSENITRFNSYAPVFYKGINSARNKFTIGPINAGKTGFVKGALVMIHLTAKSSAYQQYNGRFSISRIIDVTDNVVTVDTPFPNDVYHPSYNYYVQLITIPEFEDFTLKTKIHNTTPPFDLVTNECACGGIFAMAVSGTCDLRGGKIITEAKGGGNSLCGYGEAGLNYIGNAQMCDRLPIGAGHGSVFILANNLIMDTNTRIGASYTGNALGGINYDTSGASANYDTYQLFGKQGITESYGGFGGCDGAGETKKGNNGGYGSNATKTGDAHDVHGSQGAHIFIVANKITGFNIDAISTGGCRGVGSSKSSKNGGAGYGASGASSGTAANSRGGNGGLIGGGGGTDVNSDSAGGGGSGAFCFVYCNTVANQNTGGIS